MKHNTDTAQTAGSINEVDLKKISDIAYYYSSKWFGPPNDPECPYIIFIGKNSICAYNAFGKQYLIQISKNNNTVAKVTETIGHEMYHRVTLRRKGLHKEPWVSEMLAFLASQWFLQMQGMTGYANNIVNCYWSENRPVSLYKIRSAVHPRSILVPWRRGYYPAGFGVDVPRLGLALETIVQADSMTRMVGAKDLDEWIQSLPIILQAPVSKLLVPTYKGEVDENVDILYRYGYACHIIGHKAEAVEYYRRALVYRPEDSVIISRLNELLNV